MTQIIQKLTILLVLLVSGFLQAQDFQGVAYYQTKRNFEIKMDSTSGIPDAQQKAFQEMLKKQFEKTYILTFDREKSIYKEEAKLNEPVTSGNVQITIGNSNDLLFKNIKTKTYVDSKEEFGKRFLVVDSLENMNWKQEKETKMIGKYLCLKATRIKMVDDYEGMKKKEKQKELHITAWYTPEIPVGNGPEKYHGLPGLILELHEGKMHYVCSKLVLNPKEKKEIVAPTKGKKVSQKKYEEIMEKKSKEMMENFKNTRKKKGNTSSFQIIVGG